MTLQDKAAWVSGGGSGIGLAGAIELARAGCRVVFSGRDKAKRPVGPGQEAMAQMPQQEDLGRTIRFIAEMPAHVCINELVISPMWNRIYLGGEELKRKH